MSDSSSRGGLSDAQRKVLIIAIVPLMIAAIFTQKMIDPLSAELHKGEKTNLAGLSNEFILGPALGMQSAVAGALWVRADEFFHEGDYDAILPLVRMVTWLDPHQLDVYITGSWHLSYNFTDANERSDRRYIPAAQRLLQEGIENNPSVYDVPFELGWQNYDKMKIFAEAEHWFRESSLRKGTDQQGRSDQPAPNFVWHMLAHALEREGKIDECIEVWRHILAVSEEKVKNSTDMDRWTNKNVRDSEMHNLELTLKRKYSRYTHEINFDLDAKTTKSVDPKTGEPHPSDSYLSTDAKRDGVPAGTPRLAATARPWNVVFDGHVTFPEPKVMEPRGIFNVGDGARVTIRLHDDDWKMQQLKEFKFDVDQTQTIMQDAHSVRGGKWGRKIDMSKDPKMYSFTRGHYYLVFEFDDRATSPFIQDKFGWSGEGMTDKRYLWTDNSDPEHPNRIIRKVFRISRDQIMGARPVTDNDVISNEEYARIQAQQRTASAQ